jgi:HK97 family phage portal protein
MAGLLEALTDVLSGGPILRRRAVAAPERRDWGSVADILALQRPRSYSGVHVDDEAAMTLGAVFACVDLLSELVSTLPVDEYRRRPSGPPEPVATPPLLVDPSGDDSGVEAWLRQVMVSMLLRGNAYGMVHDLDGELRPRRIEILHPDRVSFRRNYKQGPVEFFLDGQTEIGRWPNGPLWHLAGYQIPGHPVGASPIRYARDTIGLGLATRKFGAQWFGDGAHPTAMLKGPEPIASEEEALVLKRRIQASMSDNREPLVLGGGWELDAIQVAPEESQFLETSQANVADVARYFRVPPEMIGGKAADNLTYANQEQRSIALLTYTVNPWLVRLERALSRLRPRGHFVKFNADALLRVDLKTRYEAHVLAVRGGFGTPNERRLLEDNTPLPDGDRLLWPPFSTGAGGSEPAGGEDAP